MSERDIAAVRADGTDHNPETSLTEVEMLTVLVDRIKAIRKDGTKIVSLIGGAGSGKTILAQKLCSLLGSADTLGTDDYVIGDRSFRREHFEGKEPIAKYDPDFLNERINQIISLVDDDQVAVPTYNESTGLAIAAGEENFTHKVGKVDYLVVEGDFDFVENPDLIVYFEVPDEIRLKNRVNRDKQTRNEPDVDKIIENFYLRHGAQHIPYTLPAKNKADMIVEVDAEDTENGFKYSYIVK
jgi:uridine kinase